MKITQEYLDLLGEEEDAEARVSAYEISDGCKEWSLGSILWWINRGLERRDDAGRARLFDAREMLARHVDRTRKSQGQ